MNKSEIAAEVAAGMIANTETAFAEIDKAGIKVEELPEEVRGFAAALLRAGGHERNLSMEEIEEAVASCGAREQALVHASPAGSMVPAHLVYWIELLRRKDEERPSVPKPLVMKSVVAQVWQTSEDVLERMSLGEGSRALLCANAALNALHELAAEGASADELAAGIEWISGMTAQCLRID